MSISISGKQTKVGKSLSFYVEENIRKSLKKYFEKFISIDVLFSKQSFNFKCEINIHLETNMYVNSAGISNDAYGSFNIANEKIRKRMRRYHRKIVDHRKRKKTKSLIASQFTIKDNDRITNDISTTDEPVIIAETKVTIEVLSVSQALMIMNLKDQNAILFKNSQSKKINLLYKRNDGNVSWIEPN